MRPEDRAAALAAALETALSPDFLEVRDDSHQHIGHASAGGAGHFHVTIVSTKFSGYPRVARHRAVFAAAAPLMGAEVHALSIDAKTPEEANACG